MTKIVILDAATLGDADLGPISTLGDCKSYQQTDSEAECIQRLQGAEVAVTNKVKISATVLSSCPELKLICVAATGVNNIDLEAAKNANVPVKNVAGYSTASVTQTTLGIVLELFSKIGQFRNAVQSGDYSRGSSFTHHVVSFTELKNKQWGIIGMGQIGKSVASVAVALGCEVSYYSTSGSNDSASSIYKRVELDDLLKTSDVITIHSPLNDKTRNLIGKDQLAKMKQSAVIVNMGRGGIVNEMDLAAAINNGNIAGAGMDVFEQEPLPINSPLLHLQDMNKIVMTPHVAWASKEARTTLVQKLRENIEAFRAEQKKI